MEALRVSSNFPSFNLNTCKITSRSLRKQPMVHIPLIDHYKSVLPPSHFKKSKFKLLTAKSSSITLTNESTVEQEEVEEQKFDWFAQWYPIMPVCDLDKRKPTGKKVMGIDIVVWWDKNEQEWKVFNDACPHRLAPLSEGRIDQWGRLQCVYHGWCFGGSGDCKFIPQAPRDGPPVHTSKRACVAAYPSCLQNGIVWFWPNTDPQFKDIFLKQKPPYIPEIDDPSFTNHSFTRDIPYGYEVLIENIMDPSHVPYAHTGIVPLATPKSVKKADREGGRPLDITLNKLDINGFTTTQGSDSNVFMTSQGRNAHFFIPPCLSYTYYSPGEDSTTQSQSSAESTQDSQKKFLQVLFCVPVSPGNSRIIMTFPRNVAAWLDIILRRCIYHAGQNLVLDSDLFLLHLEERKLRELGPSNWNKSCYIPTKADTNVVAFRRWLNKYGGGQVDFGPNFSNALLPPTPPREQLLDRYWSHTVNCKSCNLVYKCLKALVIALQVLSIALVGIVATAKQKVVSVVARNALVFFAVACFVGSKWLSHFIYKLYHYHDYEHAFR